MAEDATRNTNHGGGFIRLRHVIGDPNANPPIKPRIPVSKSTWYAGMQAGKFPRPVHLGRCSMCRDADINAGGHCGAGTFGKHDKGESHYADISAHLEDFRAYISAEYGLELLGDIKADNQFHYAATDEDRKGRKPVRYIVNLDIPQNIHFCDLKRGFSGTWFPQGQQPLNPAERERQRREYEANKARRNRETQSMQAMAAEWARQLWRMSSTANPVHPYLKRKGVGVYGIRQLATYERRIFRDDGSYFVAGRFKDVLLIPMKEKTNEDKSGTLWNVETIFPRKYLIGGEERDKDFLHKGRAPGLFHWIGKRTETACIAEGYADAASIFEATGYRCFVAFSAGNLPHVALAVRAALPDARIVICGDHDAPDKNGRRAGQEKANEAAAMVNGFVGLPPVESESEKMDFNDFARELRRGAWRASLRLLDTSASNPALGVVLLACVYRSPLGEAAPIGHGLFFAGQTGTRKSEVTGLALAHFGRGFNARNFPANWDDTESDLEAKGHAAKDCVFVVDDFMPRGATNDVHKLHTKADRLFRSVGNQSVRGRRTSDMKQRAAYHPRGMVLATGEDVPRGASLRARLALVELSMADVDNGILSELQQSAQAGALKRAMDDFLRWLAPGMDGWKKALPDHRRSLRETGQTKKALLKHTHGRRIFTQACWLGWICFSFMRNRLAR